MGLRAHAVERYVCEYSPTADFNYAADEIYTLLSDHDVDVWTADDFSNYCDWEIQGEDNKNALQACIDVLKKLPPDEPNKWLKENERHTDTTNADVVRVLEDWIRCYDAEDQVIRIQWF